jgi:hypothetical protein
MNELISSAGYSTGYLSSMITLAKLSFDLLIMKIDLDKVCMI